MFRSIIVPVDGSTISRSAAPYALALARRLGVRSVEIVTVAPSLADFERSHVGGGTPDLEFDAELGRHLREGAAELQRELLEGASGVGVTTTVLDGEVSDALVAHIARADGALVVMTTHGRTGLGRAILGSVADQVVRRTAHPVLLLREVSSALPPEGSSPFEHVLLPVDLSAGADKTIIDDAVILAGDKATYHLLHVLTPSHLNPPDSMLDVLTAPPAERVRHGRVPNDVIEAARARLEGLAAYLRSRGLAVDVAVEFNADGAAREIVEQAKRRGAGLVAMASRRRGAVQRLFVGSVAGEVVHGAAVPVLLRVPKG